MRHAVPLLTGMLLAAVASAGWAEVAPMEVKFVDGAVQHALADVPGDPAKGAEIVSSRSMGNCVDCHQVSALPDVAWQGTVAPPLDGVADRWTEPELRGIVANAKEMFPDSMMPSFYKVEGFIRPGDGYEGTAATEIHPILSAEQIEHVVAFLKTLKE